MTSTTGQTETTRRTATLGGGCFWCLQPVFEEIQGVIRVQVGYAGGATPDPSYREVCGGATGHAEVVQIDFDPEVISFRELLEVFFAVHDPTTPNQQGADVGPQYRSLILYRDEKQRATAAGVIRELEASGIGPVVTAVEPFTAFYPAEPEHQEYYRRNPDQPYCRVVIDPKLAKFRTRFREKRKRRVVR